VSAEDLECGTYAAYQRHIKRGERPDTKCRKAAAEYSRRRRQNPEVRRRQVAQDTARTRALSRLAKMHPAQYRVLYEEEWAITASRLDPDTAREQDQTPTPERGTTTT